MLPSPIELATVVSQLGRPRTVPLPDGDPLPAITDTPSRRPVRAIRRAIGHWLIGFGGVVGGQRETVNPVA